MLDEFHSNRFFVDLDLAGILSRPSPFFDHRKSEHFCFRNKRWQKWETGV
jgi:hypothetical protein